MQMINIYTWNANGLRYKIEFLDSLNIDIMLINETRLNQKVKLKIKNYVIIRKDKDNIDGIAILIKYDIPVKKVDLDKDI